MDLAPIRRAIASRPSRRFVGRLVARPSGPSPRVLWALSAWFGLVFGEVESGVYLAWRHLGPRVGDPDLWVNWHKPWMAPLGLAAWAFGLGVVASLARIVLPRTVKRLLPVALIGLGAWSALGTIPGLAPWASGLLALGLAVQLGRHARFDSPAFRRFTLLSLPALLGVWLALFVTTGLLPWTHESRVLAGAPRPPGDAPNVVLIVLDTVRADHLSLHGDARPTTPRFAARARAGVRFDQARATTPYTLGTHASLFTGHWMSETSARVDTPLDGRHPTLAEHLRDRGYATAGFTGNIFYGSARYGLDRGFLHYHDIPGNITRRATLREVLRSCSLGESLLAWLERKWRILAPMQRQRLDASEINREALAWLDRTRASDRPFFLFLNYFDAHAPYSLPAEAPQPFARLAPDRLEAQLKGLDRDDASPDERAAIYAHVRDSYDDGIAWIDRNLDELLAALERRGLLEDTLVIVTADHGEMLGEHGLFGHGQTLHREVVHVPLIVLGARGMEVPAGAVVSRPVSVRDIPATILDLIDDPRPDRFPGHSLARFWRADAPPRPADDVVLSEVQHMPWEPRTARMPVAFGPLWLLTEDQWAYHRQAHESKGTLERLFDLEADPGERSDLADDPAHLGTLRALREQLDRTMARSRDIGR